jgi:hypothetical protein
MATFCSDDPRNTPVRILNQSLPLPSIRQLLPILCVYTIIITAIMDALTMIDNQNKDNYPQSKQGQ